MYLLKGGRRKKRNHPTEVEWLLQTIYDISPSEQDTLATIASVFAQNIIN